jgi:hypothetical protein
MKLASLILITSIFLSIVSLKSASNQNDNSMKKSKLGEDDSKKNSASVNHDTPKDSSKPFPVDIKESSTNQKTSENNNPSTTSSKIIKSLRKHLKEKISKMKQLSDILTVIQFCLIIPTLVLFYYLIKSIKCTIPKPEKKVIAMRRFSCFV